MYQYVDISACECAPWYIYEGRNVSGCVTNAANVPICSLTDNFDRDGQFTTCSGTVFFHLSDPNNRRMIRFRTDQSQSM